MSVLMITEDGPEILVKERVTFTRCGAQMSDVTIWEVMEGNLASSSRLSWA